MPYLVLPFPAVDPVLIAIGPFAVRWYALAYIAGILLGWFYARRLIANDKLWGGHAPMTVLDYDDFIVWVTLGIILGGRIGYVLFCNPAYFFAHPLEMLEVWKGGMSFHGGFLGCVLAVILFATRRGISMLSLGDITCTVGPIGVFLGRLANFVNGELWGRPSDVPWAMVFPSGGPLPRHPSQLYEALLEGLLLFFILRWFYRKNFHSGTVFWALLAFYGLFRFLVEFVREPDAQIGYDLGPFTRGQELTFPMLVIGTVMMLVYARRPRLEPIHSKRKS